MQYWPRVRAKRKLARVRSHNASGAEKGPVGFAGYKAGMTHVTLVDNRKNAQTKGEEIAMPVTIVEVPNLVVYGVRAYALTEDGLRASGEQLAKATKELRRRGPFAKKATGTLPEGAHEYRLLVATKPQETATGQKSADLFELALGGSADEQRAYALEVLGQEISAADAIKPLDVVDVHAVTTGKGFQGPVKRFGVSLRAHKSEKTKRGPGNLGAWTGNRSYRVAHAGQMGYHQRVDQAKQVLAIVEPSEVAVSGGIPGYGVPTSTVMLVRGSLPGPKRRLVRFTPARRARKTVFTQEPDIVEIATRSQQ